MILLIDADSLIFASCYRKRENPEDQKYYTNIADARNKFDEQYMRIVNDLEEKYTIDKVLCFSGSKGNFRKLITSKYKANRKKQEMQANTKPIEKNKKCRRCSKICTSTSKLNTIVFLGMA